MVWHIESGSANASLMFDGEVFGVTPSLSASQVALALMIESRIIKYRQKLGEQVMVLRV